MIQGEILEIFAQLPSGKSICPGELNFFYISSLKSLNLVLNSSTESDGHRGTKTGCGNQLLLQVKPSFLRRIYRMRCWSQLDDQGFSINCLFTKIWKLLRQDQFVHKMHCLNLFDCIQRRMNEVFFLDFSERLSCVTNLNNFS